MAERGVGATIASVALFSVLLLANVALVLGEQGRMVAYSVADGESRLYADAKLLEASSVLRYMGWVQGLLSSGALSCDNATSTVDSAVAGHSYHEDDGVVRVEIEASAETKPVGASEPMLHPFDGFSQGSLNLRVHIYAFGVGASGSATYLSSRYVDVHIDALLERASSACISAVEALSSSLQALRGPGWRCNTTAVSSAVGSVVRSLSSSVSRAGFGFSVSFSVGPGCHVSYTVHVYQFVAKGPSGPFTFTLRQVSSVGL